jgi:hypothetical protein
MSLVRLLLYANEIDIEGLGATTSVWQREKVSPEIMHKVIDAYGRWRAMRLHDPAYPTGEAMAAKVYAGRAGYGMAAVDVDHPSPAALALIAAAQRRPAPALGAVCGARPLAEALGHAKKTMAAVEFDALIARLRVYAISDQDDAGAPMRRTYRPILDRHAFVTGWRGICRCHGPAFRATNIITAMARARISRPFPTHGWIKTSGRKARWARPIRTTCSSWKATRPRSSALFPMA